MLEKGARQLSPKPFPEFCSLFHVLLWLVESHWTHPMLARVLTGMEVDKAAGQCVVLLPMQVIFRCIHNIVKAVA